MSASLALRPMRPSPSRQPDLQPLPLLWGWSHQLVGMAGSLTLLTREAVLR